MSTYIVRPTSVITNGGKTSPSSAATVLTNLGDNSDTTSVRNSGSGSTTWVFGLGTPSIATDEFVCRVGQSIRWSQSSSVNNVIAGSIVRTGDPAPTGYPAKTTSLQPTAITTELGLSVVAWSRTDCTGLKYYWYDQTYLSGSYALHYDIFGTIYTLKLATCAPTAQTWSTSTTPTVAVPVTATIDWEASTYDWQKLRTITVEVRIESGGSGVGTGTLKSTATYDSLWTASGTNTINVPMSDSLANGTYNVYARAIRHREYETTIAADQYGVWSSAATLTMSVTPPSAPTLSVSADNANDRVTISVTPVSSTGYTSPTIDVQRSSDSGATWTAVRNATGVSGTFGSVSTFYDYEAPRGVSVAYRARQNATYSGVVNASAWTNNSTATLTVDGWNLKCPENSALNMLAVQVIDTPTESLSEDMGVFRPIDRTYPVVVAGVLSGWDGDLTIQCSTSAEWTALKGLLQSQKILLLESNYGWNKYIRVMSGANAEIMGTATTPRRRVTLQYVQTDAP